MDIQDAIAKIERAIRDVKRDYDLFFKGDIRRPPLAERDRLQKLLVKLQGMHLTNTQIKFKIQTLGNSFLTLSRQWDRIMAQIEAGTYQPDRFKADLRVGRMSDVKKQAADEKSRPNESERELRRLYRDFIDSRQKTGESTKVSFDAFQQSLEKQRPALEGRLGRTARFRVVVEEGRAKVKGS